MNSKKIILLLSISSLISVIITVGLYIYKFGSLNLSENNEDWVSFANYFNGLITPVFTFLNLILLSYLTLRLVKIDDDRNTWTLQELTRPYATLLLENTEYGIDISIHNVGLGPMIITDIIISDGHEKQFSNFYDLVKSIDPIEDSRFSEVNAKVDTFELHSGTSDAIGKEKSHYLFRIYFHEDNINNRAYVDFIKKELNNYTLIISYNDMYNRKIGDMNEKINIKEWQPYGE